MTKETFLFGYGPLSRVTDRVERSDDIENDLKLQLLLGHGVVYHNRRDVMDWALEERNNFTLRGICTIAAVEIRFDLLEEIFNGVGDWGEKEGIFKGLDFSAASCGLWCAMVAAHEGHIHILKWLREEKVLELFADLYIYAINNGHLHVMKWLREQACPWNEYIFKYAAEYTSNLDILQWLHNEGCPWPEFLSAYDEEVKPDVFEWLHVNGYGDRISRV